MGAARALPAIGLMLGLMLWLLLVPAGSAAAASRIGVASSVVNRVSGTLGGVTSPLKPGDPVFQHQVVASEPASRAQLMFLDETVFSIGPASRVVLDRFVYDPRSRTGDVVMNVTKGAFRFISGSARPSTYTVKTPVATIGLRGTFFLGWLDALGNLRLLLRHGKLLICTRKNARLEGTSASRQKRRKDNCTLVEEPGEYFVRLAGSSGTEPGEDPLGDDGDPNSGIDNLEDPFSPPKDPYNGYNQIQNP